MPINLIGKQTFLSVDLVDAWISEQQGKISLITGNLFMWCSWQLMLTNPFCAININTYGKVEFSTVFQDKKSNDSSISEQAP